MSDARVLLRVAVFTVALGVAGMPGAPLAAQAVPSVASLRARLDSATQRAEAAESTYRASVRQLMIARGTDTVRVGGVSIAFTPSDLPARHRRPVIEGVRRAITMLEERFGDHGASLLDSAFFLVREWPALVFAQVSIRSDGIFHTLPLGHAVQPEEVERFVLLKAAIALPRLAPVLARFTGQGIDVTAPDDAFVEVARELALSRSAAGRRCFTGDPEACRAVFALPATDEEALALWYEPADYRSVVAFGARSIAQQDSARQAALTHCAAGDDDVCARLVRQVPVGNPHGIQVRITLAEHALDIAPRNALAVLSAADSASSPVAALARAAGVSEDSLIAGWHRRTIGALESGRPSPLFLVASTAFWGFLLLELAIRRRPL